MFTTYSEGNEEMSFQNGYNQAKKEIRKILDEMKKGIAGVEIPKLEEWLKKGSKEIKECCKNVIGTNKYRQTHE